MLIAQKMINNYQILNDLKILKNIKFLYSTNIIKSMKHIYLKLVTFLALILINISSYALPVGWNNAQAIQVQNNTAVSVTDYQVL